MHTLDKWKMTFGFILLILLGTMGLTFAHGRVEANTSFGLMPVLTTLSTLAGAFASWAFTPKTREPFIQKKNATDQDESPAGKSEATRTAEPTL